MEEVGAMKGGGGHHHGGGGRWHGTPWAGWGPWGPYYDVDDGLFFDFDTREERLEDLLGFIDIGAKQREMNTLKQVPVSVARVLLRYGLEAIETATPPPGMDFPGQSARANVTGHLHWHQDALAKQTVPSAMYGSGDDLKKWVMQAFIEQNATQEGMATLDRAWAAMWAEIREELAKLPAAAAKMVGEAASGLLGIPPWALGVGAFLLVGGVAYAVIKGKL